jgi:hypothetical protein
MSIQQAFKETKSVVRELVESINDINSRNPKAVNNTDLVRMRKAKNLLEDYSTPDDFTLQENKLLSAAQIGDKVYLFYRNQKLDGIVIGVHFIKETVKYDVELSFGSVKWDKQVKTRIYGVHSGFVSKNRKDLPLNEDLYNAVGDMGKFVYESLREIPSDKASELLRLWNAVGEQLSN